MRYMMLIYSNEMREISERNYEPHRALIDEATRAGVFVAAEPLAPSSSTTTLQIADGRTLITDGPFAESKEQLGGYYILIVKTWIMRSNGPSRFIPPALRRF